MAKKVFAMLLSFCLVLSIVPYSASATGTDEAKIGEQSYATLEEAVAAATAGQTVVLNNDVALDGVIQISKEITVDLAGYDITMTEKDKSGDGVFMVTAGGKLTLNDTSGNNSGIVNGASAGNYYDMTLWAKGGEIVINGGTYTNKGADSPDGRNDMIYAGSSGGAGGTITINGGVFESESGAGKFTLNINNTATSGSNGTIIVKGGTFVNYNPANGDDAVPGPFVAEGYTVVKAGDNYTVTVDKLKAEAKIGDTFYVTLEEAVAAATAGQTVVLNNDVALDGVIQISKEITIDLAGYDITMTEKDKSGDGVFMVTAGGKLTLNDTSGNNSGIVNGASAGNYYDMTLWAKGGEIVINGGTYTNKGADSPDGRNDMIYAGSSGGAGGTITINGGVFESESGAGKFTLNINNTATSGSNGTIIVKGGTFVNYNPANGDDAVPGPFVAEGYTVVKEGDYYTVVVDDGINTEAELIAALTAGGEITLSGDITVDELVVIPADKSAVLNLNGKVLNLNNAANYTIVVKGSLTVNGEGTVNVSNYGIATSTGSEGKLTINGGKFVAAETCDYIIAGYGAENSKIIITGGEFVGDYCVLNNVETGTVAISGGVFTTSDEDDGYQCGDVLSMTEDTVVITGGSFSKDPSNAYDGDAGTYNYVAEGYTVVKEGDYFTVKALSEMTYTVTFVTNGGNEIADQTVAHNGTVTKPADPSRAMYAFAGWYVDETLTLAYDFTTPVTADITLYAKWESTYVPPVITPSEPPVTEDPTEHETETVVTESEGGVVTTTTVDENGTVLESETEIPAEVAEKAAEDGETVTLDMPAVENATNSGAAPEITITTNCDEEVSVEIPVNNPTAGTVVVIVNEDGTETVVTDCIITEDGVVADLPDGATVKVVNKAMHFNDVDSEDWFSDAVAFVSARGILTGTGTSEFGEETNTSRAMVWTLLARMAGVDTTGGSTWYEKAQEWAMAEGITDGTDADGTITREQLVTMLWRYIGEPETAEGAGEFEDANKISSWAEDASNWAVENEVMNGYNNNLDPQGLATRAQLAQFIMNFIYAMK